MECFLCNILCENPEFKKKEEVKKFSPHILLKCKIFLDARKHHGHKYKNAALPENSDDDSLGYHSSCFKQFAVKKMYLTYERLDRKSSRGMIFENEELRLRTININAEVERGQTDIKRLRRENDQLRREIWTLRDECDRLNKKFKAKILDHEHGNCNVRGSGGGSSGRTRCPSQSNSDDSDSCDTCKGYDGHCSDDCCQISTVKQNADINSAKANSNNIDAVYPKFSEPQHLHNTFDHLSVVSEETLSNNDVQATAKLQNERQNQHHYHQQQHTTNANGSQTTLSGIFGQLTPLTPIELVANQLNDLQATVPPLSYFENIVQQHMGSTIGTTPETANISPNSKIVKHTNGWDYNLQSPFAQRKPSNLTQSSESTHHSSGLKQRCAAPPATLSTFASTSSTAPPQIICADVDNKHTTQRNVDSTPKAHVATVASSKIETVAITTMPTTAPPPSPKHFFSPLKPRLKINTALANKNASIPTPPIVPSTAIQTSSSTIATKSKEHQNCDPPDIFVTNALASPYKRPSLPSYQSSPQLPQRNTNSSSNTHVSSRQCQHHSRHHQHQYHLLEHQEQQREKFQRLQNDNETICRSISPMLAVDVASSDFDYDDDDDDDNDDGGDADTEADGTDDNKAAALIITEAISTPANIEIASLTDTSGTESTIILATESPCAILEAFVPAEKSNICLSLPSEPIYAIAQESSFNLISASAVTKPLMTATIDSPSKVSIAMLRSTNISDSAFNFKRGNQVESINLESILNDIEHISEDILAIQLDKTKPRDIQNSTKDIQNSNALKGEDKIKKPYRSEMNLLLSYDGINPTITPASVTTSTNSTSDNVLRSRARSLERDKTETPSPKMPDAMPEFPDSRAYVGLDKSSPQNIKGSKSVTASPKKLPPTPPIRLYPSQHNTKNNSLASGTTTPTQTDVGFGTHGLVPNKSHLFKALANAAAKRGQYRLNSPVFSKSLDNELASMEDDTDTVAMSSSIDKALNNAEALNRKMRRVSIVCGNSPHTPDSPTVAMPTASTPVYQLNTASCTNLTATPTNPILQSLKQITCHSTPNSPHSVRRRTDSYAFSPSHDEALHMKLPHNSNNGSQCRRSSQASLRSNAQEPITASINPTATRSKCSRRNSEGTVVNHAQRTSGVSGHHHHHHHHHQHGSSTIVNGRPRHSHISHQDNQEAGSGSDRNSSSFASSGDSTTSFSVRSQRRKISVSSHTGGKIPWCGCWGNGCL